MRAPELVIRTPRNVRLSTLFSPHVNNIILYLRIEVKIETSNQFTAALSCAFGTFQDPETHSLFV